jgi:hypothetical protein
MASFMLDMSTDETTFSGFFSILLDENGEAHSGR